MGDSSPRDSAFVESLLKEMGVDCYDPMVVHQLLEVCYRYVSSVLEDARTYSEHALKKEVDLADVRLAIRLKIEQSFSAPPPRDYLMEAARQKNATPLPLVPEKFGLRLPPERYCLTAANYNVKHAPKQARPKAPPIPLTATFKSSAPLVRPAQVPSSTAPAELQSSSLFPMSPLLTSHQLPVKEDSSTASGLGLQLGAGLGGSGVSLLVPSPSISSGSDDMFSVPSNLGNSIL